MAATLRNFSVLTLIVTTAVLVTAPAMAGEYDGTRATRLVGNEAELLLVFSAGLAGDAFGYDGGEIINRAAEIGMPVQDVLPTFYMAYLSGESFTEVSAARAAGASWGDIADKLRVEADALNAMAIPADFEVTEPKVVDDDVYLALFTCSALAHVYGLDPERTFDYYDAGWTPLDVMAAAAIAHRTQADISRYLPEARRQVNWYAEGRQSGMDLVQLTRDHGRTTEDLVPVMAEEPRDADLETLYAIEMAAENWEVPIDHVRRARYRYLYSPSEVMVAFYVGNVARCDYYRVGRLYAHTHHRRWGPTIVALGIPTSHFSQLTIWSDGRVDFVSVQPVVLNRALLSLSLSYGCPFGWDYFYTRFDPWFTPCDAILYCGVYRRHPVYFDSYYNWVRDRRPRRHFPQFVEDYGRHRRSADWVGSRRVGAITGSRHVSVGSPPPRDLRHVSRPGPGPSGGGVSDRPRPGTGGSRDIGFIRGRRTDAPSSGGRNERFTVPTPGQPRSGGSVGQIQPPAGATRPDRDRGGNERFTVPTPGQPRSGGSVGHIQPPAGATRPDRDRGGNERFTVPTPGQPRSGGSVGQIQPPAGVTRPDRDRGGADRLSPVSTPALPPTGGSVGYIQPPAGATRPDRDRGGNQHFTVPTPRVDTPQRRPEVRHSLPPNYGTVGSPQIGTSTNIGGRPQPPQMTPFGFGDQFSARQAPTATTLPPRVTAGSVYSHGTGLRTGSGDGRDRDRDRDRDRNRDRRPGAIEGRRR